MIQPGDSLPSDPLYGNLSVPHSRPLGSCGQRMRPRLSPLPNFAELRVPVRVQIPGHVSQPSRARLGNPTEAEGGLRRVFVRLDDEVRDTLRRLYWQLGSSLLAFPLRCLDRAELPRPHKGAPVLRLLHVQVRASSLPTMYRENFPCVPRRLSATRKLRHVESLKGNRGSFTAFRMTVLWGEGEALLM